MSEGQRFEGVGVALVTPFDADGGLDLDAFAEHAHQMIEGGVDYLVPCGTTGESATMSSAEQVEVIRTAVRVSNGRVPVVAGAGANATAEAVERSRAAAEAGADGILSVAPYYNKPPQEGLFQHFEAVAAATDLPVVLYNVPGRTSSNILPETVLRLAEIPNIVAIKEAVADMRRVEDYAAAGLMVYSGDDPSALEAMRHGARGVISVAANVVPRALARLCEHAAAGDFASAGRINDDLEAVYRFLALEANPIPVKWLLATIGRIDAGIRLPLVPLDERHHAAGHQLAETLAEQ